MKTKEERRGHKRYREAKKREASPADIASPVHA